MARILFRGTRADVRRIAYQIRDMLVGRAPDRRQVGYGFALCLGFGALSDIKDAFVTKADGGTDEMGISWPDLSPKTKAYSRRFGPGEQARLKAASGLGPANKFAPGNKQGMLTADQLKRWKSIYGRTHTRMRVSLPEAEAKARAGQIAWAQLKREGAKTKLSLYGHRKVQILRDTGVLLNSLSPGVMSGQEPSMSYSKPIASGGEEQIFDAQPGRVAVGTNVAYASAHQDGKRSGHYGPYAEGISRRSAIRRQMLPENEVQIPEVWWDRWLGIALRGLEASAAIVYKDAA